MQASSMTNALERRARRWAADPSRASSVKSCRDLGSRKPGRIIRFGRIRGHRRDRHVERLWPRHPKIANRQYRLVVARVRLSAVSFSIRTWSLSRSIAVKYAIRIVMGCSNRFSHPGDIAINLRQIQLNLVLGGKKPNAFPDFRIEGHGDGLG
jgi:hypothetical protein